MGIDVSKEPNVQFVLLLPFILSGCEVCKCT